MSDEYRELTYKECDRIMRELSFLLSRPYHDRQTVLDLMATRIERLTVIETEDA